MAKSIEIKNLYKIFGKHPEKYLEAVRAGMDKTELNDKHNHVLGLNNINITMPGGKITVVMGLSGSGKSTLIRHINRLIDPTAGEVLYDGEDICSMNASALRQFRRHKTAMVFQKFGLLPHRTVLENSVYGLESRACRARRVKRKAVTGWSGSAWPDMRITTRTSFQAACSSALALPAH